MTSSFQARTAILVGMFFVIAAMTNPAAADDSKIIARINGKSVTADRLHLDFYLAQFPQEPTPPERLKLINRLIDQEIIRQFLEHQKVEPDPAILNHEVKQFEQMLSSNGKPAAETMARLHLTPESLKDLLWVSAAWQQYLDLHVQRSQVLHDWDSQRFAFDGSRVRARQIVKFVKPDAPNSEWITAEQTLSELRSEIMDGKTTFADAAKRNSDSPSGANGGDMGEFEYRGRVDESVSAVAFHLMAGEVSHPFRTRFGVHLIQTDEVLHGQLSLEDALPELKKRMSERLRSECIASERQKNQIQMLP